MKIFVIKTVKAGTFIEIIIDLGDMGFLAITRLFSHYYLYKKAVNPYVFCQHLMTSVPLGAALIEHYARKDVEEIRLTKREWEPKSFKGIMSIIIGELAEFDKETKDRIIKKWNS